MTEVQQARLRRASVMVWRMSEFAKCSPNSLPHSYDNNHWQPCQRQE